MNTSGKELQLLILTTKDGVSYEFFGTPIENLRTGNEVTGIAFGPNMDKTDAIRYLREGSKFIFEGKKMEGEGAWTVDHAYKT